jgi:hypothetical protein
MLPPAFGPVALPSPTKARESGMPENISDVKLVSREEVNYESKSERTNPSASCSNPSARVWDT